MMRIMVLSCVGAAYARKSLTDLDSFSADQFFTNCPHGDAQTKCPTDSYQIGEVLGCAVGEKIGCASHFVEQNEMVQIGIIHPGTSNLTMIFRSDADVDLHIMQGEECIVGYGCQISQKCEPGVLCHTLNGQKLEFSGDDTTNPVEESFRIDHVIGEPLLLAVKGYAEGRAAAKFEFDVLSGCTPEMPLGCASCSEYTRCSEPGARAECDGTKVVKCVQKPTFAPTPAPTQNLTLIAIRQRLEDARYGLKRAIAAKDIGQLQSAIKEGEAAGLTVPKKKKTADSADSAISDGSSGSAGEDAGVTDDSASGGEGGGGEGGGQGGAGGGGEGSSSDCKDLGDAKTTLAVQLGKAAALKKLKEAVAAKDNQHLLRSAISGGKHVKLTKDELKPAEKLLEELERIEREQREAVIRQWTLIIAILVIILTIFLCTRASRVGAYLNWRDLSVREVEDIKPRIGPLPIDPESNLKLGFYERDCPSKMGWIITEDGGYLGGHEGENNNNNISNNSGARSPTGRQGGAIVCCGAGGTQNALRVMREKEVREIVVAKGLDADNFMAFIAASRDTFAGQNMKDVVAAYFQTDNPDVVQGLARYQIEAKKVKKNNDYLLLC